MQKTKKALKSGILVSAILLPAYLQAQTTLLSLDFNDGLTGPVVETSASTVVLTNPSNYLNLELTDGSFRSVGLDSTFGPASLANVGDSVSLSMDVARDASVGGELRVYLLSDRTAKQGYFFQTHLGSADQTLRVGTDMGTSVFSSSGSWSTNFTTAPAGSASAVSVFGSGWTHYKFVITRTSSTTMDFQILQDDVVVLNSTGNDVSAYNYSSINDLVIGWTQTDLDGHSFQLDNIVINGELLITEAPTVTIGIVGNDVELSFVSDSSLNYQLLKSTDSMVTFPAVGDPVPGNDGILTLIDTDAKPTSGGNVFYRVEVAQ